jgi:hypothetical protein
MKTKAESAHGGPGRIRTSNQTVMSGGTIIAGVDFPKDLTCSIVFVVSRCDRFWCETGAVIAACLREAFGSGGDADFDGLRERPEVELSSGPACFARAERRLPGTMVAAIPAADRNR